MRALCSALCLLAAATLGACAHTAPERADASPEPAEVVVLRERVQRLEKRISDLDAQVALLTERVASSGGHVAAAPAPRRYEEPPRHVYAEVGSRSIDLSPPASVSSGSDLSSGSLELSSARDLEPPAYEPVEIPEGGDALDGSSARAPDGPPDDVKGAYDWAHARMREGRYLEALAVFEDILERHGEHDLADNALYWTAVCHEKRGDTRLAIEVYERLPMLFPKSPKLPDALYGMAVAHESLGEPVLAETLYGQLVQLYPKAEKAPDARRALRRLGVD